MLAYVSPFSTAMAGSTLPVFDNEMVMRFIRNYRDNQCLWDFNSPTYKNKAARDLAYEKLVAAMDLPGLTVTDVKNKIKNIRSTYCQELKKIQTAAMLGRDPYVPSVFWFRELDSFLHANTTPRTDIGEKKVPKYLTKFHNLPPETTTTDFYFQHCSESAEETNHSLPEPDEYPAELPLFVQQNSIVSLAEEPAPSEVSEPPPKRRKRDKDDKNEDASETMRHLRNISDLLVKNDEEFEIFGRSVAVQLKKMSLCTALKLQAKIQSLLSQHRIEDIKKEVKEKSELKGKDAAAENDLSNKDELSNNEESKEESDQPPASPSLSLTCASEHSDNENVQ